MANYGELGTRTVLVTGATGAIGAAIARGVAARPGFIVVLGCRDEKKGRRLAKTFDQNSTVGVPRMEIVDVSNRGSIADLRRRWQGPLHVLINNAAETPKRRKETPEGIERQFATNVLGYFWMMQAFEDLLDASTPSRVVNVASYWAGDLDLDDLEFKKRPYNNNTAYRQSKQANRMLTVAFAEKWAGKGITVNACHPGDVNSSLSNSLGFGGHETPEEGAEMPISLATGLDFGHQTGLYFENGTEHPCRFSRDRQSIRRLVEICQSY